MSALGDLCRQAGLDFIASEDEVRVMFTRELTAAEDEVYLNILFPFRQAQIDRRKNAINEAVLATQLKSLTPQQAVNYIENNVTNLATAKDALKIMTRILIALRDEVWPGLPEK